jgi:MoaA/NifB/PqqE/SkfB family radical SAM enzyme
MNDYPKTLFYLIDVLCNEKCTKCGHWKYKTQKTIDDISYLVRFINEIKWLKEFVIVGGEPLIYKSLILDILKQISPKIKTTIITNGVLADNDFIDALKELNTHLVFSIDTIDKDFWEYVRGQNTYDRVFQNFYYALEKLDASQISVQSVLSVETLPHVEEVANWLAKLGIYHSIQNYISDGFGGSWTEIEPLKADVYSLCFAYKYNMSILPNGNILTCFQQPLITDCQKPLGNITTDSFLSIIESKYFNEVIEKMKKCSLPCKVLKCNIEQG